MVDISKIRETFEKKIFHFIRENEKRKFEVRDEKPVESKEGLDMSGNCYRGEEGIIICEAVFLIASPAWY
jgi:hypothetical protein